MFGLGTPELIVIGVLVFLIFGTKRLPDIGKGIGGAIREFRQVKKDLGAEPGKTPEKKEIPPTSSSAKKETGDFSGTLAQKALEQVPAVKQVLDLKEKVNKVREIL